MLPRRCLNSLKETWRWSPSHENYQTWPVNRLCLCYCFQTHIGSQKHRFSYVPMPGNSTEKKWVLSKEAWCCREGAWIHLRKHRDDRGYDTPAIPSKRTKNWWAVFSVIVFKHILGQKTCMFPHFPEPGNSMDKKTLYQGKQTLRRRVWTHFKGHRDDHTYNTMAIL